MSPPSARDVLDCSLAELQGWCEAQGVPQYRAAQIATWLYRHGAREFPAMRNLPAALREQLAADFHIGWPELVRVSRSTDGTRKLLLRLADGATRRGRADSRRRSPHALRLDPGRAAPWGAASAPPRRSGSTRHLRRGEIVGQYLVARALVGGRDRAAPGPRAHQQHGLHGHGRAAAQLRRHRRRDRHARPATGAVDFSPSADHRLDRRPVARDAAPARRHAGEPRGLADRHRPGRCAAA